MREMIENLKLCFNLKKVPPKTQRAGDVGWMVDCEIAEGSTLANLRQYLPNIPTPLVLGGGSAGRKNFLEYEPEIEEEPELPEDIEDLPGQECPGSLCFECGWNNCVCWPDEEEEEPKEDYDD